MSKDEKQTAFILFAILLIILVIVGLLIDYYTVSDDELKRELMELQIKTLKREIGNNRH